MTPADPSRDQAPGPTPGPSPARVPDAAPSGSARRADGRDGAALGAAHDGAGDGPVRDGAPAGRRLWPWRAAAAVALVVHLAALYAPSAPDTGGVPLPPWTDLVVHVVVFAALTFTALRARLPVPRAAVVGVLLAHAPVSELVQHLALADRTGDARDVAADVVGVALGWAAARLVAPRRG